MKLPSRVENSRGVRPGRLDSALLVMLVVLVLLIVGVVSLVLQMANRSEPTTGEVVVAAEDVTETRDDEVGTSADETVMDAPSLESPTEGPDDWPATETKDTEPFDINRAVALDQDRGDEHKVTVEHGVTASVFVRSPYRVPAGRSPMLQPGEQLDELIPAGLLGQPERLAPTQTVKPGEIVPWTRAHLYVGQTITVEGKIVLTNDIGDLCFLNFDHNFQGKFYLVIFRDVFSSFPERAESYFLNKTVRATGKVVLHRGTPQIQIREAGQIEIHAR